MKAGSRLEAIDGLRGVACLAVVAHHCYYTAGQYQRPFGAPRLLSYGYLGVEIFFVLSGFCLANPLIARDGRRIDWWLYAKRRARRILPAYCATVALCLVVSLLLARFTVRRLVDPPFLLVPTLRQFVYVAGLIAVWFVPVFWTLTVEARWYFVLPLFVNAQRRFGNRALVVAAILVSVGFALFAPRLSERTRFLVGPLPLFLPLFASGVVLAAVFQRANISRRLVIANRFALVGSIVLVLAITPAHPLASFTYQRIVPGGTLATCLLFAALFDEQLRRALSWKPLVALGLISYSLYLIHYPIVVATYRFSSEWHWPEWRQLLFYQALVLPVCIALASIFYLLFERPFMKLVPSRRAD